MASIQITRRFAHELLDTILQPLQSYQNEACSICGQEYKDPTATSSEKGPVSQEMGNLTMLDQLPYIHLCQLINVEANEPIQSECGHHFCLHCISVWLSNASTCPICRQQLDVPDLKTWDKQIGDLTTCKKQCELPVYSLAKVLEDFWGEVIFTPDEALSAARILLKPVKLVLHEPIPENISFSVPVKLLCAGLSRIMRRIGWTFLRGHSARDELDSLLAPGHPLYGTELRNPLINFSGPDYIKQFDFDDLIEGWEGPPLLCQHKHARMLFCILAQAIGGFSGDATTVHFTSATAQSFCEYLLFWVRKNMSYQAGYGGTTRGRWWAFVHCVITYFVHWQFDCNALYQWFGFVPEENQGYVVRNIVQTYMIGT